MGRKPKVQPAQPVPSRRYRGSFQTKYGYFSGDGLEYVITRPDTPRPWVNVITNSNYGLVISQSGTGYSWIKDITPNRITCWQPDFVKDEYGKFIYIRDNKTTEFWSATWKPVCRVPDFYECKHGIGYSIITSLNNQTQSRLTVFVTQNEPIEIWELVLLNKSDVPRSLGIFSYIEWQLDEQYNEDKIQIKKLNASIGTEYIKELSTLITTKKTDFNLNKKSPHQLWDYYTFHSVLNATVSSFTQDKESFLGLFKDTKSPRSVEKGMCFNREVILTDPVASLHIDVQLKPKEEKQIIFITGIAYEKKQIFKIIKKYKNLKATSIAHGEIKQLWTDYLDSLSVHTPDDGFDLLNNIWLKYQIICGRPWAKNHNNNSGVFFKDVLQNSQIFLYIDPRITKEIILLAASCQFGDGNVNYNWDAITQAGCPSSWPAVALWLPWAVSNYIKETKDFKILKEKVKYIDLKQENIFNHCRKAVDYFLSCGLSKRSLPLIGSDEEQEGLIQPQAKHRGEAIYTGCLAYKIINEFAQICQRYNQIQDARFYRTKAELIKHKINRLAWDGNWYIKAFRDTSKPIGTSRPREKRIFLNAQAMATICNVADKNRQQTCMENALDKLENEYGLSFIFPVYKSFDAKVGYISGFHPGTYENGGISVFSSSLGIWAECILGDGNKAFGIYSKISPIIRSLQPDLYILEPYVTAEYIDGPDSRTFGRGINSWDTKSANWLFKIGIEQILGIRPTYDGLIVDPCIPKKWSGFKVKRVFRGTTYFIEVTNPRHVSKGITEVSVDGKKIHSNLIHPYKDGKPHKIKVVMG